MCFKVDTKRESFLETFPVLDNGAILFNAMQHKILKELNLFIP